MSLFLPDSIQKTVIDIHAGDLTKKGIKGLVLDVDDTLSMHSSQTPFEGVKEWLAEMHAKGFRMIILSNARKKRVEPFARELNLPFRSFGIKPFPFRFFSIFKKLGLDRKETAMIGDQLFTDVLGGNLCGMYTILVIPSESDPSTFSKIKRRIEKWLLKKYNLNILI